MDSEGAAEERRPAGSPPALYLVLMPRDCCIFVSHRQQKHELRELRLRNSLKFYYLPASDAARKRIRARKITEASMNKLLFAGVAFAALAGQALAADLPSSKEAPVYVAPPPAFTWTGFYVGAQIGYGFGASSINDYYSLALTTGMAGPQSLSLTADLAVCIWVTTTRSAAGCSASMASSIFGGFQNWAAPLIMSSATPGRFGAPFAPASWRPSARASVTPSTMSCSTPRAAPPSRSGNIRTPAPTDFAARSARRMPRGKTARRAGSVGRRRIRHLQHWSANIEYRYIDFARQTSEPCPVSTLGDDLQSIPLGIANSIQTI